MITADRRLIYWSAGIGAAGILVYALRGILPPFIVGMIIGYLLHPVAKRLESWSVSRGLASALLVSLFFLLFVLFVLLFVPVLQDQVSGLLSKLPDYATALQTRAERWSDVLEARLPPEDFAKLQEGLKGMAGSMLAWLGTVATGIWAGGMAIVHFLALVIITPLVAFYMLRDWERIVARVRDAIPHAQRRIVEQLSRDIDRTLSAFVRGQAIVCLILAAFYATGLALIGLDFGIVIGIIIGILAFIPFIGSVIGLVLSVGLAMVQFDSSTPILLTLALFVVGHILEGQFLTPRIVGHSVGLHPVWVIFALLAGGALLDVVGVLLAVPVAAAIGVLVRFGLARSTART